jgi:predicted ArsR family transcriptional regulator
VKFESRAYLTYIRNLDRGLASRTQIIHVIETKDAPSTADIADELEISYSTVRYHLKNLERESVVRRRGVSGTWHLLDQGQAKLVDFS